MRPLELRLSGLQSYRAEQRIDFQTLCKFGLFGICGPTGSGKSTLIDAITLALYGKVGRATNGTQGIMNQTEKQLFVSFMFALTSEGEQRIFRVERKFKRTGTHTISNTLSRFVELTAAGETVTADKLVEVTRCVEQYIGLKMDDFTRAVVLPQGKFAEFLCLKGSERRKMLQRLFALEKYGDELAVRISQHVKEIDAKLMTYVAEQQGLGDASAATVAQAEDAWQIAVTQAEQVRAERLLAEETYNQHVQQRERQQQHALAVTRMEQLQAEATRRAQEEMKVKQAKEAVRLLPFLLEKEQLQVQCQRLDEERRVHIEAVQQADIQVAKVKQIADEAKRNQEQEEPQLLRQHEQLQEALHIQQTYDRLAAEERVGQQRLETAQAHYNKVMAEAAQLAHTWQQTMTHESEVRATLAVHYVSIAEREHYQQAIVRYEQLTVTHERCEQLRANRIVHEKQAEEGYLSFVEKFTLFHTTATEICDNITTEIAQNEQRRFSYARLHTLFTHIEKIMEQLHQQQWQVTLANMAHQLAATLVPAQSCPVCGSTTHPAPAQMDDPIIAPHDGDQQWSRWERFHAHVNKQLLQVDSKINQRHEQLCAAFQKVQQMAKWAVQVMQEHEQLSNELARKGMEKQDQGSNCHLFQHMACIASVEHIHHMSSSIVQAVQPEKIVEYSWSSIHEGEAVYHTWQTEWTQLLQPMEIQAKQLEQLLQQLSAGQVELQQLSFTHRAAVLATCDVQQAWQAAEQVLAQQREAWRIRFHKQRWEIEAMPVIQAEWKAKEEFVHDCHVKLTSYMENIEQMKETLQHHEQLRQGAEIEQGNLQTELTSIRRMMADYQRRLQPWVQQMSISEQLQNTVAQLSTLREQVKNTSAAAECVRNQAEQVKRQAALSDQAYTYTVAQLVRSEQRLQEQLQLSSFTDPVAITAAVLSPTQSVALAQQVAIYKEEVQAVAIQLKRLEAQLGGERVTEAEWLACLANKEAAIVADEVALAVKAKAEQDVERLKSNHQRWSELERNRNQAASYAGQLQQLQTVFRGNAFVEFIAEEQLIQVSCVASERLLQLTRNRYALAVDAGEGFIIRDNHNGGICRPVSTLSGGETFLTSLALALALSMQIQLRGQYPLEFFFLDEGFGTLDPELLDTVVTALEQLHTAQLCIGVISHVPELQARLISKIEVVPAQQTGAGSKIVFDGLSTEN